MFMEYNNARNGSREKEQSKANTKMEEIHHIGLHIRFDGNINYSGGGTTSISHRYLGSDVMKRICSQKKKYHVYNATEGMINVRVIKVPPLLIYKGNAYFHTYRPT